MYVEYISSKYGLLDSTSPLRLRYSPVFLFWDHFWVYFFLSVFVIWIHICTMMDVFRTQMYLIFVALTLRPRPSYSAMIFLPWIQHHFDPVWLLPCHQKDARYMSNTLKKSEMVLGTDCNSVSGLRLPSSENPRKTFY